MNKLRWGILAVVLVVCAALFFGFVLHNEEYTGQEFMFDTLCSITAYGDEAQNAVEAALERAREIHSITNGFSGDSEVSGINSAKAGEKVKISRDIAKILQTARKVETASNGAFDVSIASVVRLWNFDGEGRVPSEKEIAEALSRSGGEKFIMDFDEGLVIKKEDGILIDLGGVAKGYAADEAVKVLKEHGVQGAIVDFGGNILCFGKNPNSDDGLWRVGVQKPFAPLGEVDEENIIEVSEAAVVTSGTYQRYFEKNGEKYHHIIDTATGYPANREYSSVTVVAENGLVADCLSTACFVLGKEKGTELAKSFGAEIFFK
ncbi:MAG: FAD:protein FMN transferase [Clostridia bacterium]|nr:FAD:protein FMN transferase [Clostridia bacterium]